jgi:hypothetical protein
MAGAQSTRRYASPFRIKPCLGQFSKNGVQSVSKDRCDVFQDNELGSYQANDSDEFVKQARPSAVLDTGLIARDADVLAWKSAANNVG